MPDSPFDRFQQFQSRRVSPAQGMGVETQTTPSSGTTGVGAILGGTVGALGASRLNPLATEAVAAGGAAMGDLAEVAIQQAIDPSREVNVGSAMKSAGKEAALSLVGGGLVRGAAKTLDATKQFAANRLARKAANVTPEAQMAIDIIDSKAKAAGIPALTPAEMTENSWIDFADNIAKNSVMGSELYRKFLVTRQGVFKDVAEEFKSMFGQTSRDPASIGKMLLAVTSDNKKMAQIPAKMLRNEVEDRVAALGLKADVTSVRTYSKQVLKDVEATGGLAAKRQGKAQMTGVVKAIPEPPTVASSGYGEISEQLQNLPATMPVSDLIKLRTSLLDAQQGIKVDKKLRNAPVARHIAEQVKLVNDAIEEGLKQPGSSPDLLMAWKTQNKWFSQTSDQFSDELATQIIKSAEKNPAGIADAIMKSKKQDGFRLVKKAKEILVPDNIKTMDVSNPLVPKQVGSLVLSQTPWKKVQSSMMQNIIEEAWDPSRKTYLGGKMLEKITSIGDGTLSEAFGPQTAKELTKFAEALNLVQAKNPVAVGGMAIQFMQAGAALSLFRKVTGEAITVLLGPKQIAKIMTTRDGVKMLREGIQLEKSNPKATALVGRLLAMAGEKAQTGEAAMPPPAREPMRENQAAMLSPLMASLMGPAMTQ